MTGVLDLFVKNEDRAPDVGFNPVLDTDVGFGAEFDAAFAAGRAAHSSNSYRYARGQYVQSVLDKLWRATGESYQNPEDSPTAYRQPMADWGRAAAYGRIRNRLSQLQKERPDLGLGTLSDQEIEQGALQFSREQESKAHEAAMRAASFKSKAGVFLGGIAASLIDPVNLAANAVLLPFTQGRSVLGAGAIGGGVGGASEMLVQAFNYDYRKKVDPNYTLGVAAQEVGMAAAGGFVLQGGIRALAKAYSGFRAVWLPRATRDAGAAVTRAAAVAKEPFPEPPASEAIAHAKTIQKVEQQIALGLPVEPPIEAKLAEEARPAVVFASNGRRVGVQYQVVEARDLITSHDRDLRVNPAYPEALQPRARERAMSQAQIQEIAAKLQPERLGPSPQADSGAPIVGPDNIVESGNGRVLAIQSAYERTGAAKYRQFLKSLGYDVENMDQPVLIARRTSDLTPEERVDFANAANQATAMRLGAAEQAAADARLIDEKILTLKASERARAFIDKLPVAERGSLIDKGGAISTEGNRRLEAALLARAYGDQTLLGRTLESADNNIKSIGGALADSAASWARMKDLVARGVIPRGMDITRDVLDAVRILMQARDTRVPFNDLINQAEMFNGPSEIAKAIGRFLYKGNRAVSRSKVAAMLEDYAAEAEKNVAGDRLFGEPLTEGEVLKTALDKAGRSDLFGDVEAATTPEAIDKAMETPDSDEALVKQGERLLEPDPVTGKVPEIMVPDEEGNMVPLADKLTELDEQIKAGEDIEGCLTGTLASAAAP